MIDYSESWLILTLLKWKGPSAQDRIVDQLIYLLQMRLWL